MAPSYFSSYLFIREPSLVSGRAAEAALPVVGGAVEYNRARDSESDDGRPVGGRSERDPEGVMRLRCGRGIYSCNSPLIPYLK